MEKNSQIEDSKQTPHEYNIADKALCNNEGTRDHKLGKMPWTGPCKIQEVNNDDGTVVLKVGTVLDRFNIRNIKPFNE